jgi:hypothetical protein
VFPVQKNSTSFRVEVNGVVVGTVSDNELQRIQKSVNRDWRTWARWVGAGLHLGCSQISRLLYSVPMTTVWMVIVMAVVMPNTFTAALGDIIKDPAQAAKVISQLMQLSFTAAIGGHFARYVWKASSPRATVFGDEVARRIRQTVNCPAEGQLTLTALPADAR